MLGRSLASIGIDAELLGDPACLIAQGLGFWSPPRTKILAIEIGELYRKSGCGQCAKEQNFVDVLSNLDQGKARSGWRNRVPSSLHLIALSSIGSSNQSSVTN